MKIACVGGGAASFFFAAEASSRYPNADIVILEQGKEVLQKVKISGGGRCNVTHNCFDPQELVLAYPRGQRELLGPFYHFNPEQTLDWFQKRGVNIVAESDGRMFPESNQSQTIVDCLTESCVSQGVKIQKSSKVVDIVPLDQGNKGYKVHLLNNEILTVDKIFIGAGSSKYMWNILTRLGHKIIAPVPSLFTFKIADPRLRNLPGVAVSNVELGIVGSKTKTRGPLLITHKGLSAPAVLKMSAVAARELHAVDYKFDLIVDFRPDLSDDDIQSWRTEQGKHPVVSHHVLGLPKRLCASLIQFAGLDPTKNFASLNKAEMELLKQTLKRSVFKVLGQNRFKEEFVTAGGVDLREINFKNFSSKKLANMYMAGEILNIDALTGGYNFQAAWTGAYLSAIDLLE